MTFNISLSGKVEAKWFTLVEADENHPDMKVLVNPPSTMQLAVLSTMDPNDTANITEKAMNLAVEVISDWKGVSDGEGNPLPCEPEFVRAALNMMHVWDGFAKNAMPFLMEFNKEVREEKNASTASPNGTTETGNSTARNATRPTNAKPAHTKSSRRKGGR